MKILLCMLSDQPVPNILSVHEFQPERLIFIVSDAMNKKNRLDHFLDALEKGGLNYRKRYVSFTLPSVSNFEVIRQCFQQAYEQHRSDEWIVNLTGGTKPMSIVAYEFFKAIGAQLVYVEASKPDTFLMVGCDREEVCEHKLSIKEFIHGYGFELKKNEDKIRDAEKRAERWAKVAELMARDAPDFMSFNTDDDKRRNQARKKGVELQKGELSLPENISREAANVFNLYQEGDSLYGRLDKYGGQFFTGGWLEMFLWSLLDRHKEALGIWNVRLGIEIGRIGANNGNDLDICFMHDHALCAIECKSGSQEQDKGVDVLYKVEAVIRQFRALRVRPFLATTSSHIYDNGKIKSNIENRALLYNCQIITSKDIGALAKDTDNYNLLRSVLFEKRETQDV